MNGKDVLYTKSMKKKTKAGSDTASVTEDDIWDDSVLVEAYNKAIHEVHENVLKHLPQISPEPKKTKAPRKRQWSVGDFCRCEFSEDHIYYEANVIDIIQDLGMCVVKYLGYDNEEKVPLTKLRPSKGETARSVQKRQAQQEQACKAPAPVEKTAEQGEPPQSVKKKSVPKKPENARAKENVAAAGDKNFQRPTPSDMFKPTFAGAILPPPPPHMFTKLDDDVHESDAMSAMLMSWYMSGYHTGYYQGLKAAKK